METKTNVWRTSAELVITSSDKPHIIKTINKARLTHKNLFLRIEVNYSPFKYLFYTYSTWVKVSYKYKNGDFINRDGNCMDATPTQFKQYLNNRII